MEINDVDSKKPCAQPTRLRARDPDTAMLEHLRDSYLRMRAAEHMEPPASPDDQFDDLDGLTEAQVKQRGETKFRISYFREKESEAREGATKAHEILAKVLEDIATAREIQVKKTEDAEVANAEAKKAKKKLKATELRVERAHDKYLRLLESTREVKEEERDAKLAAAEKRRECDDLVQLHNKTAEQLKTKQIALGEAEKKLRKTEEQTKDAEDKAKTACVLTLEQEKNVQEKMVEVVTLREGLKALEAAAERSKKDAAKRLDREMRALATTVAAHAALQQAVQDAEKKLAELQDGANE